MPSPNVINDLWLILFKLNLKTKRFLFPCVVDKRCLVSFDTHLVESFDYKVLIAMGSKLPNQVGTFADSSLSSSFTSFVATGSHSRLDTVNAVAGKRTILGGFAHSQFLTNNVRWKRIKRKSINWINKKKILKLRVNNLSNRKRW